MDHRIPRDDHFARIPRALRQVHADDARPFSVEGLARKAGISVANFHHHFKLVTTCSPLRDVKCSRGFKRLFGVTPVEEAEPTRARLVAG